MYNEEILYSIALSIGTPIKLDKNTYWAARGPFARFCVEIDLTKPLISQVDLEGRVYNVEYENFSAICYSCGRVGHRKEECGATKGRVIQTQPEVNARRELNDEINEETELVVQDNSNCGPWMMAPKRYFKRIPKAKESGHGIGSMSL